MTGALIGILIAFCMFGYSFELGFKRLIEVLEQIAHELKRFNDRG